MRRLSLKEVLMSGPEGELELPSRDIDQVFASRLETWLAGLIDLFGSRALPVNLEVGLRWGFLASPRGGPQVDRLLAATAIAHDITLASRNTQHVRDLGVRLVDPFHPVR